MKLTPHAVLEMMHMPRFMAQIAHPIGCARVISRLRRAVHFDFGTIKPDQHHSDFALDMGVKGLFTLPFPDVLISFDTGIPDEPPIAGLLTQLPDGALEYTYLTGMIIGNTRGAVPLATYASMNFTTVESGNELGLLGRGGHYLLRDEVVLSSVLPDEPDAEGAVKRNIHYTVGKCLGAVIMLMSKGVETTRHEPPAKLNKARAKKGKPGIGTRFTVKINLSQAHDIDGESIAGYKRGSPRMHWRRGHFRTIHRGEENERVVPVPPMIIGARDDVELPTKQYVVS